MKQKTKRQIARLLLTGKGVKTKIPSKEAMRTSEGNIRANKWMIRAGEGTIRAGQNL